MRNIRNAVDKREIIQYLKLRECKLHRSMIDKSKSNYEIKLLKSRHSEITILISLISKDKIVEKIRGMHKDITLDREYKQRTSPVHTEAKE